MQVKSEVVQAELTAADIAKAETLIKEMQKDLLPHKDFPDWKTI